MDAKVRDELIELIKDIRDLVRAIHQKVQQIDLDDIRGR